MDDHYFFNGLDGETGEYLFPPMTARELLELAGLEPEDPPFRASLRRLQSFLASRRTKRALMFGVDPERLDQAGWGVLFPAAQDPRVRRALSPLIDHRRRQARALCRELAGHDGYRADDTFESFLRRHGAGSDPVDPRKLPYYLLLVGGPEEIPFAFQYQLAARYAVGRIGFDDVAGYHRYAESVITAERFGVARSPQVTLFGVENAGDPQTQSSCRELIAPLVRAFEREPPRAGFAIDSVLGPTAAKSALAERLGGTGGPAVLFTASHGIGRRSGDESQSPRQGALVCSDWEYGKPATTDCYFAAADVEDSASVAGVITFHFSCYGAGTPLLDNFSHVLGDRLLPRLRELLGRSRPLGMPLALRPFLSALPQRLLGHPNGGALAVVGHVDRAWETSFSYLSPGSETLAFESTLRALLAGVPIGHALEPIRRRYTSLAADLSIRTDPSEPPGSLDPGARVRLWMACNDARNYTLLGDPAVRVLGNGGRRSRRRG